MEHMLLFFFLQLVATFLVLPWWLNSKDSTCNALWETWVWSLGGEDPLEGGHGNLLHYFAWRPPWTEEPSGLQSVGSQTVGHDWINWAHTHTASFLEHTSLAEENHENLLEGGVLFVATIYIKQALTYRRYLGLCLWLSGLISRWEDT